ncbi:hypothetical protein R1flu_029080 [Riccia fluitans]|uniref:RING-type domain-containing protein n=1 Tax=Riccia fluitans TaxID=41844 RepID=A0ABD1XNI1_9MARC
MPRQKIKPPIPRFNRGVSLLGPRSDHASSSAGDIFGPRFNPASSLAEVIFGPRINPASLSADVVFGPRISSASSSAEVVFGSRFNHPSSTQENVFAERPADPQESTEEDDKKLVALMEKSAALEREVSSQVSELRNTERELTDRQEKLFDEFSKLNTEERDLMKDLSLVEQKKRNADLSFRRLQDEVSERRSLLRMKETELNDAREQLDRFHNILMSRLEDYRIRVKRIEMECNNVINLFDSEKAQRMKLDETFQALEQQVEGEELLCQICMVNKKNMFVLPCMHFLFCRNCLVTHRAKNNTCPACRGFVSALLQCKIEIN